MLAPTRGRLQGQLGVANGYKWLNFISHENDMHDKGRGIEFNVSVFDRMFPSRETEATTAGRVILRQWELQGTCTNNRRQVGFPGVVVVGLSLRGEASNIHLPLVPLVFVFPTSSDPHHPCSFRSLCPSASPSRSCVSPAALLAIPFLFTAVQQLHC